MNRRDFLRILLSSAAAEAVDFDKLLWIPKPIITVPELPLSLYGIPYHIDSNIHSGTWMGISRELEIQFVSHIKESWGEISKKCFEEVMKNDLT